VGDVLRSGWLTTGKQALAFESEFAAALDAPHALAVNSATAGLHLALEAVGVGPGDYVIVPSLTFTATAEVVRYLGAEVAFADVGASSLLVDPSSVARLAASISHAGGRTAAIIPVHLAGEPCDMDSLKSIATEYGAALIEDAAHAFPAHFGDRPVGTIGDIGVFSFYANKTITTGEGGMVVTGNEEYARRMATMRSHGIDRQAWHRYTEGGTDGAAAAAPHWYYQVVAPGFKYNLADTAAAIGRVQLRRANDLRQARVNLAERYLRLLAPLQEAELITLPLFSAGHAWHLFILRLNGASLTITRDEFIEQLRSRHIGTSVHYIPLHHMPYWRDRYFTRDEAIDRSVVDMPLANTDRRYEEIVSIPLYPDLSTEDQDRVITAVSDILGAHRG
jgi:dTDP-4-amino-4,6-dideoxygalactose transaminase